MEIQEIILIGIVAIPTLYLFGRVLSLAIFKSWFNIKDQHREELKDGNIRNGRHDETKVGKN